MAVVVATVLAAAWGLDTSFAGHGLVPTGFGSGEGAVRLASRDKYDVAWRDWREFLAFPEPTGAFEHKKNVFGRLVLVLRKLSLGCIANIIERQMSCADFRGNQRFRFRIAHCKRFAVAVDVEDRAHEAEVVGGVSGSVGQL